MNALLNLWRLARKEGPRPALETIRHRASERFHEWRFGVETAGGLTEKELGFTDPACRKYEATDYTTLFRLLRSLDLDATRDVFIDFGSGKGRVVLVAATLPFRRVIGVELSEELSALSRRNIERARPRLRCPNVESVTCGADVFAIPPETSVVFFWNPFAGEILERVLENLHRSWLDHPRRLRLIGAYPPGSEFEARFNAPLWLKTIRGGLLREHVAHRIAEVVATT